MKKIYLCGGAVRDELLGIEPKDLDYCVTGYTTQEFMEEFPDTEQIGKSFPVMLVDGCEYAFARTERSTGDGHTDFQLDSNPNISIEEDLQRRDLTINAIAKDMETGELIYGSRFSKADIKHKVLRPVSYLAFIEDPLRILRAARFSAKFPDFEVSGTLIDACLEARPKISTLPKERVFAELENALKCERPRKFFEFLRECGCLKQMFPEIHACIGVSAGPKEHHPEADTFVHIMEVVDKTAFNTLDPIARFAAVCHDLGKALTPTEELPSHHGHDERGMVCIENLCDRLGTPNKYRKAALIVCEHHMKIYRVFEMRPGTMVKLAIAINKFPNGYRGFFDVVQADGNEETHMMLLRETCLVIPEVKLPEKYYGRGKACAEILMNLRTSAYKNIKQSFIARM